MTATGISMDRVVQAYTKIRDARTAARHEWEARDAEMEADQARLKAVLLQHLNTTQARSVATEHGTFFRTEKVRPSAADWPTVYGWIAADPDRFELLEKRLKATFVKDFMEENAGAIPPGVNIHREFEVSVRRPSSN